jgi:16S rRNA (uracil1498-N3)-methyltransferase
MHRVCVPNAAGPTVALSAEQSRHLLRVVRLGPGDPLVIFDGRGGEWAASVEHVQADVATVTLVAARTPVAEPSMSVTLAIGVLTGDDMSDVVRDATALGVTSIAPFVSAHSAVSRRRDWSAARDRWARVAASSAAQSGRAVVPTIESVEPLEAVRIQRASMPEIVCVEPAHTVGAAPLPNAPPPSVTLYVGPEGGWADTELAAFASRQARFMSLGPRTLRAALAPTVALSTLWASWTEER